MSERRRKSGSDEDKGDRRKRLFVWLAWGLVVALLGGNLATFGLFDKSYLSPDVLWRVGVWAATATSLVLAMFGMFWIKKASAETERSSHAWLRRGFVFSMVGAVLLVDACYQENDTLSRNWLSALATGLFAANTVFFAMAAYREYHRAHASGGRRGRSSDATAVVPPTDATSPTPAASPDAAK